MNKLDILHAAKNVAVVGMNPHEDKFAYKINAMLNKYGKNTYGVNANYDEIEGHKIYDSISDIDAPIQIAVMVVNPTVGLSMVDAIAAKGVETLWLQPGTRSEELIERAKTLGLQVVEDCVLQQYEPH